MTTNQQNGTEQGAAGRGLSPQLPAQKPYAADVVREVVASHITRLQYGYRNDHPNAVSTLARIRRGAGRPADSIPDLWGLVGAEALYARRWSEDDAVRAENAVHLAVTLWSLHQQSHRDSDMHVPRGPQLGGAVRRLMPDGIDEPIRKRFVRAGTASSLDALAQRLRELVLLFRLKDIPLDYGQLAAQLYRWQRPGGRAEIHRSWGRSFHAYRPPGPPGSTTGNAPSAEASASTDKDLS